MLADFPILLILTDREHRRLASQIQRLRTYALDADQLSQLRESWSATLGYVGYLTPVLGALDHLIGELEQGEYDTDDYDEVIHQISQYRRASWKAIRQTLGATRPYLDRWGKVRPDYRYAFEREYEPQAKLSTVEQGRWLRALLTQLGFPVGEAEGELPESLILPSNNGHPVKVVHSTRWPMAKQATPMKKTRAEIQAAPSSITDSELARQYGVATATIWRWRYRDDVYDRPHTRHNLLATLTAEQEEVLITAREFLRLGLDDLLVVAREFLNPGLSRSALHRMLKRREVPTLAELARQDAGGDEKPRHKPFKDYEPGYVHIDIKHLPQMPDEEQKRYLKWSPKFGPGAKL